MKGEKKGEKQITSDTNRAKFNLKKYKVGSLELESVGKVSQIPSLLSGFVLGGQWKKKIVEFPYLEGFKLKKQL